MSTWRRKPTQVGWVSEGPSRRAARMRPRVRKPASSAQACRNPPGVGRSLGKDGEEMPQSRHSSDLACHWEHPELVYITPRQGSRQEVWITSVNKDLPGCPQVEGPSWARIPTLVPTMHDTTTGPFRKSLGLSFPHPWAWGASLTLSSQECCGKAWQSAGTCQSGRK